MEDLKFKFEAVRAKLFDRFGKKPDMQAILFLIGLQELGQVIEQPIKKETKQDLMHIAICRLFLSDGYFSFSGLDAEGWPHYDFVKPLPFEGMEEQEEILVEKVVEYFDAQGLLDL